MVMCPRCKNPTMREPDVLNALSRRDNKTYICSACGTDEALFDYEVSLLPEDTDPVRIERLRAREQLWLKGEEE